MHSDGRHNEINLHLSSDASQVNLLNTGASYSRQASGRERVRWELATLAKSLTRQTLVQLISGW